MSDKKQQDYLRRSSKERPWTEDRLRKVLDSLGNRVVAELMKDPHYNKEVLKNNPQEYCRKINGETLALFINEERVPGMIMTLESVDIDTFKGFGGWGHHAVGVLKLSEGKYAVFDQTNDMVFDLDKRQNKRFLKIGTLEEVSQALDKRFGEHWNLPFIPRIKPERSVLAKIKNAEKFRDQGKMVSYERDIAIPVASMIDIGESRPLGLRVMPPGHLRFDYA